MNKPIVITGSTRGIGYSLAAAFLERDCAVTISGRTQEAVNETVAKLGEKYSRELIFGFPCDVNDFIQVQKLWENTKSHFGKIDIWINNAGIAIPRMNFWVLSPDKYEGVVQTNIIGTMYGTKVALTGMVAQGNGALYNMEGFGARGGRMGGMTLYGSIKASCILSIAHWQTRLRVPRCNCPRNGDHRYDHATIRRANGGAGKVQTDFKHHRRTC